MEHLTQYSDSTMKSIGPLHFDGIELFSGRVAFLIEASDVIARHSCPCLTIGEWCAIVEANNGQLHLFDRGFETTLQGLWQNLLSLSGHSNHAYSVDGEALFDRLVNMPPAEQLAVFEIACKFWQLTPGRPGTLEERFTRLGAPGLL